MGMEIILGTTDGTPRCRESCGSSFRSIWRLCSSHRKITAWFAPKVPQEWKSFWAHPMVLLGDVGQVEACFGPLGDSVNLDAR